jgi:hypothetical protein
MARFRSAIIVAATLSAVATAGAQSSASKPQTISGCLQRTDAGTYVLTNVDMRMASGQSASASGAGAASGSLTNLPVIGLIPPSVALRNFVDQRVEVAALVKDSPTKPGTPAVEILDGSRLPPNTTPVKAAGGSCK